MKRIANVALVVGAPSAGFLLGLGDGGTLFNIVVRNPQRSRVTILNSTAYPSNSCENHPVGRWYQQTPNDEDRRGNHRFDWWS